MYKPGYPVCCCTNIHNPTNTHILIIYFTELDQQRRLQEGVDTISVRLVAELQQQHDAASIAATVIQLSRPVPVIKRACSPPLLELQPPPPPVLDEAHGVHFLTPGDTSAAVDDGGGNSQVEDGQQPRTKTELLEYLIRGDGSVTCKLCGEILASRTHWYRHKYKLHANATSLSPSAVVGTTGVSISSAVSPAIVAGHPQPSPLYKCEHCSVFFKSKKGYMGHVAARHTVTGNEDEVVITGEEMPAADKDVEKSRRRESGGSSGSTSRSDVWEKQREKEEKLVADIIDRVRRECEAQGAMVSRRGYSRRSTVMNTCN